MTELEKIFIKGVLNDLLDYASDTNTKDVELVERGMEVFCSSRNETFGSLWVDSPIQSIKLTSVSGRIRLCWEAT